MNANVGKVAVLVLGVLASSMQAQEATQVARLPYIEAGLDARGAAAFLLDRFTYGATPGQVDAVVETGLERWLALQVQGNAEDPALAARLAGFDALGMSDEAMFQRYPSTSLVRAHMRRFHEGLIPHRDEVVLDFSVVSAAADRFAASRGFLSQDRELQQQLLAQKILRATHANNQLREVMTDFWQNHFYTSPTIARTRPWLLSFESAALRPNALANFATLLSASTRHPAMLQYHSSTARLATSFSSGTTMELNLAARAADPAVPAADLAALRAAIDGEIAAMEFEEDLILERQFWPGTGPNREFVRAIVELQTLGPDAATSDEDIEAAGRIFTGWGTLPRGPSNEWFQGGLKAALQAGFVVDGSFLFRADRHDAASKQAFGLDFPAGGGVEEGEALLLHLARQPATALHIARKIAMRFVDDTPPPALVERLATAFRASDGDIGAVITALAYAPDFWQAARAPRKIKTPLEYTISALRATQAEIADTTAVADYIARMGQPLYAYEEPNGYPDDGAYWLDSASLIARLQFAGELAADQIPGVSVSADAMGQASIALLSTRRQQVAPLLQSIVPATAPNTVAMLLASPAFQLR